MTISMKGIPSRSGLMNPDEMIEGKMERIVILIAGSVIPYLPINQ
jgi:hypothetical protein